MNRLIHILLTLIALAGPVFGQSREVPLQPGDSIGISIAGIPPEEMASIKNTYRVDDNGNISLLYLQTVRASGLTASELARSIEGQYKGKEIYTNPSVNVSVDGGPADANSRVVFINGEVTKVGQIPYRAGLTASQALATAGGPTPYGKPSKTKLMRAGKLVGVLDLAKVEKQDGQTLLQPNDELVVPD